jgi:hypothetical protein
MKNKIEYTNRYNDVFTFSKTDDGNILFEGEFKWMRCSWPNVYDDAYRTYVEDNSPYGIMEFDEFKKKVHEYDYSGEKHSVGYTMKDRKYAELVYSDRNKIDMIDPSGGPYMHSGYDMGMFDKSFKGMIVEEFKSVPEGYLIKIKK